MALGFERAIAEILEDAGLGSYGSSISVAEEPPTPDTNLTVHREGGTAPISTVMEKQSFSVVTRSPTFEAGCELAKAVHTLLHEYQGQVRGIPIAMILADFLPVPLGRDLDGEAGRWRETQTFTATTRRFAFV